jgi:hypothetical protein
MIDTLHGVIVSVVRAFLPIISDEIGNLVKSFNAIMANGTSILVDVFDERFPLNITLTQPPQADTQNKLLTLNFDGTFFDKPEGTNHVRVNTINPTRLSQVNSNQFFVHQTMLASLLMVLVQEALPARLNATGVNN